ncbi:MAG: hypothetical protein QFB87_02215 [Patescibacteria group bacterium]|nr:hypothetical protein [Patescibacteria group bacterium]
MLGNNHPTNANERRPNAELVAVQQRLQEIAIATRDEHQAELNQYPGLFTVVEPAAPTPAAIVTVPSQVAGNVITLANQREARVLNEQEERLAVARQAASQAHEAA